MRHLLIGIALITTVGCTEPAPFERDSPYDFEGVNYVPSEPDHVQIREEEGAVVRVTWYSRAQREVGFEVERSIDSAPFEPFLITEPGATTFIDQSTDMGSYVYRIRTLGNERVSAWVETSRLTLGIWSYASTQYPGLECTGRYISPISNNELAVVVGSGLYTFDTQSLKWSGFRSSQLLVRDWQSEWPIDIHTLPQGGVLIVSGVDRHFLVERWNENASSMIYSTNFRIVSAQEPMTHEFKSVLTDNGRVLGISFARLRDRPYSAAVPPPQFFLFSPLSRNMTDLALNEEISLMPLGMVYLPTDEVLFTSKNSVYTYSIGSDTWERLDISELMGFAIAQSYLLLDGSIYLQREVGTGVERFDLIFDPTTNDVTVVEQPPGGSMVQLKDGRVMALSNELEALVLLDPEQAAWNRIGELPGSRLKYVRAITATPDGRLYVLGIGDRGDTEFSSDQCWLLVSRPL